MGFVDINGGGGPSSSGYGVVPTPIYRFLDTVGDGSGTKNANISGSAGTPNIIKIQPAPGEIMRLTRMIILIRDSKAGFTTDAYGALGTLGVGIEARVQNNTSTLIDLTDGVPIQTNGNWGKFCYDAEVYPADQGNTDTYLRVRWTFEKAGYPIRLIGDNNERLEVLIQDNLTGLVEHYFHVQGYYEDTT